MSKATKHRDCPASGRVINSAECGAGRNTLFECPASCEFNPFAPRNYNECLEIETKLDDLCVKYLLRESSERHRAARTYEELYTNRPLDLDAAIVWELFYRKNNAGLTCTEEWLQKGPNLKNDLAALLRWKSRVAVWLVEAQSVLDDQQTLCRDLLDPERPAFIIYDRSFAAKVCRYDRVLCFGYRMPHYARLLTGGTSIPAMNLPPVEIVLEIVRHLGGPTEGAGLQYWLVENFSKFREALWATIEARRKASIKASGFKWGRAVYRLRAPFAECQKLLDTHEETAPDSLTADEQSEGFASARVWRDAAPGSPVPPESTAVLGRVLMGQSHWRLEAIGEKSLNRLQERFSNFMGERVELEGVRLDDLHRPAEESPANSLVPPRLLENPQILEIGSALVRPAALDPQEDPEIALVRSFDLKFLDTPVRALDGATPRAAAADPRLRPRLIELLKTRINQSDRRNLETGAQYDPQWYIHELGTTELCLTMPPRRFIPPELDNDDEEDEDEDESYDDDGESAEAIKIDYSRPLAPAVPPHIDYDEIERRYKRAESLLRNSSAAINEAHASGAVWLARLDECETQELPEDLLGRLYAALLRTWLILVPQGKRVAGYSMERLLTRLTKDVIGIGKLKPGHPELEKAFQSRFQRLLHAHAVENLASELSMKDAGHLLVASLIAAAAIDEMHLALQEQNQR